MNWTFDNGDTLGWQTLATPGRSQQTGASWQDADRSVIKRVLTWEGMASVRVGLERAL